MKTGVSIITATYNLLPYLKKTVESLLELDFDNYEIIIIDDGSSDGTKEYLQGLEDKRIKLIFNEKNIGTCLSRNRGIEIAKYPILAFIDHDCIAEHDWLKKLIAGFTSENIAFVIGQVFYVAKGYKGYFPERLVSNIDARLPINCNMAYRKEVLQKVGGFDDLFRIGNEDYELALRVIEAGYKYTRTPDAIVYHQAIDWSVRSLLRAARRPAVWAVIKKRYPKIYLHFYYPIKWGHVISPEEYLYLLFSPIIIPILLFRYLKHGKRDLKIFFAKWPIYLILKRYYIYREAIKQRVFMI
jgi:GT2 family glycosyltransferase